MIVTCVTLVSLSISKKKQRDDVCVSVCRDLFLRGRLVTDSHAHTNMDIHTHTDPAGYPLIK